MTDQERYRETVEHLFVRVYGLTLEEYLARIVERFRLAGYTTRDCRASLYHALEDETIKAERAAV